MFRRVLSTAVAASVSFVAAATEARECTAAFCLPSAVSKIESTTLFVPQQVIAVQSLAVPSIAVQQTTTPLVIQQVAPLGVKQQSVAVLQQVEPVVVRQKTIVRSQNVRIRGCNPRVRAFGRGVRCR